MTEKTWRRISGIVAMAMLVGGGVSGDLGCYWTAAALFFTGLSFGAWLIANHGVIH